MGVAEIAPSTAENAPNYLPTGYTVTPLILILNLIFHVWMLKNRLHKYLGHPKPILDCLGVMGDEKPLGGRKTPNHYILI